MANYSGLHARAEIAPFSVCPGKIRPFVSPQNRSLSDFPPPFGDDFRTMGGGQPRPFFAHRAKK